MNTINPALIQTIIGIFILLILATAIMAILLKKNPNSAYQEVALKIRTWWIMVSLFVFAIAIDKTISIIFFAFLSFLSLKEYLTLIPTRRVDRSILFWVYLAIPIQYLWVHLNWFDMFLVFIPVYLFLFLPMRMVLASSIQGYIRAASTLHWGAMVTIFCLSHVAFLLCLPWHIESGASGPSLVLFLVALTELNDVLQFLWGKRFGKAKILPLVSPNKTWAGFIGGVVSTTTLSIFLAPMLTPLNFTQAIGIGVLISLGGFFGDMTLSAVKRDIGVKDSSHLLPGHGGILDRVDSLTYTAPLFFHTLYYLHY